MSIGTILMVGSGIACSYITDVYLFMAVFLGVLMAMGPCFILIHSMWIIWSWYPTRKGLMTGFLMLGYGGGTSLITLLLTFLINPENRTPDLEVKVGNQTEYLFTPDIARRVPMALRTQSLIISCLSILALLLVRCKPSSPSARSSLLKSSLSAPAVPTAACPSLTAAILSPSFWFLFLYMFCAYSGALFMLVQYKNYAMTESRNDQLLAGIGSSAFAICTLARFCISLLTDYIPFKSMTCTLMLVQSCVFVSVPYIVHWIYVYLIWVCVAFVCYAGMFTPIAMVCERIFGPE